MPPDLSLEQIDAELKRRGVAPPPLSLDDINAELQRRGVAVDSAPQEESYGMGQWLLDAAMRTAGSVSPVGPIANYFIDNPEKARDFAESMKAEDKGTLTDSIGIPGALRGTSRVAGALGYPETANKILDASRTVGSLPVVSTNLGSAIRQAPAMAGAVGGAAKGAAIGSPLGPAGMFVGGLLGGGAGQVVGRKMGNTIDDAVNELGGAALEKVGIDVNRPSEGSQYSSSNKTDYGTEGIGGALFGGVGALVPGMGGVNVPMRSAAERDAAIVSSRLADLSTRPRAYVKQWVDKVGATWDRLAAVLEVPKGRAANEYLPKPSEALSNVLEGRKATNANDLENVGRELLYSFDEGSGVLKNRMNEIVSQADSAIGDQGVPAFKRTTTFGPIEYPTGTYDAEGKQITKEVLGYKDERNPTGIFDALASIVQGKNEAYPVTITKDLEADGLDVIAKIAEAAKAANGESDNLNISGLLKIKSLIDETRTTKYGGDASRGSLFAQKIGEPLHRYIDDVIDQGIAQVDPQAGQQYGQLKGLLRDTLSVKDELLNAPYLEEKKAAAQSQMPLIEAFKDIFGGFSPRGYAGGAKAVTLENVDVRGTTPSKQTRLTQIGDLFMRNEPIPEWLQSATQSRDIYKAPGYLWQHGSRATFDALKSVFDTIRVNSPVGKQLFERRDQLARGLMSRELIDGGQAAALALSKSWDEFMGRAEKMAATNKELADLMAENGVPLTPEAKYDESIRIGQALTNRPLPSGDVDHQGRALLEKSLELQAPRQ